MYGLLQAGKLAHDNLVTFLYQHGYYPASFIPGLWKHRTRKITFTLVVDDFGVKYTDIKDFQHLADIISKKYTITTDLTGSLCIGVTLE